MPSSSARSLRLLLFTWLVFASIPAYAAYSGLTIIPTADLLPAGHVCVDYQLHLPTALGRGVDAAYLNTQTGVGNRAEVGLDFDLGEGGGTTALLNGKLALRSMDTGTGLAAGFCNAGEDVRPTSYLAATRCLSHRLRAHVGVQRTDAGGNQGFGGVDCDLTGRLWMYGEYLAGDENASALTLYYQLTEHWGVSLSLARPNDPQCEDSIIVDIGCVLPVDER